jgi:hypothetical protein
MSIDDTDSLDNHFHSALNPVGALFSLIALENQELAEACYERFKECVQDPFLREENEGNDEGLVQTSFIESANGDLIFAVDWKDTGTFLELLDHVTHNIGLEIVFRWPDDIPTEDLKIYQLLALANDQLAVHDCELWQWQTDGDTYQGWIARTSDAAQIEQLAAELGFLIGYPQPFEAD